MAEDDLYEKPQSVYEKYEAGEATLDNYLVSLSGCTLEEYVGQKDNVYKIYTDLEKQSNNPNSSAVETQEAEHYLTMFESIQKDREASFKQTEQPAATQTGKTRTSSLAERTRQGHDRLHGGAGVGDKFTAFNETVNDDYTSFIQEADDGITIFDKQAKEAHEDNTQQVEKEYEENKKQVEEEHEAFSQQVEEEYEDNKQQVEEEHEAYNQQAAEKMTEFNRQKAEEERKFIEEMQQYQQNPYTFQDYSAKVASMGLTNSTILAQSRKTGERSSGGFLAYIRNTQTEFRQADNGFALMQDNQVRAVTIDGNNNLHFQINENGQTRDMTKEEANAFLQDLNVKKQASLDAPLNDGLLNTIEAIGTANMTPEKTRDEINEDFAKTMEQPWKYQEIHEAEHKQFEEMDMSPENVAADNRQAVNEDFAKEMEQPWKYQEIHEAEHKQFEEMDMSPENVAADNRIPTEVEMEKAEAILRMSSPEQGNIMGDVKGYDAPAQEAPQPKVTLDTSTILRDKMNKAMNDAAGTIKGAKIEKVNMDNIDGKPVFTPRETATDTPVPAPSDDKTVATKTAPAEERAAPAAPTAEQTAPTPTTEEMSAPVTPATPTVESHEAEALSPDIAEMAKKIQYMNTVNNAEEGSPKYVDPQETAQKMYTLYGDNAQTLLNEALMAPNDVNNHTNGAITDRTQTYSREAVNYLANLSQEQAKEYANNVLSPSELAAQEKSPQEKLQDNMTEMKTNNPEQYGDLVSAISQLANGGDIGESLMQLVIQMMKHAGYANSPEGQQEFTRDAQAAIQQIEHNERLEKAKTGIEMPTTVNVAQTQIKPIDMEKIKGIKLDSYGLIEGSEQAQKHNEDLKQYRELYKTDPKKFEKAKEGYEKAVKSGETTGQAKYNLDVINTVEKEEKLKEQMLKDQEKAAKQIKKLEKKIEKAKSKGNDEKADELTKELDKLLKEQGLKKEEEAKDGKEVKDGKGITGQAKETPVAAAEYAEATQNGYKITKGDEVQTVTFENGGRIMHFAINDQPMTQEQANLFMEKLQQAPNLDQDKVSLTMMQKNINEMSGTIAYAPPKTGKEKGNEPEREIGTQDNTLSLNTLVAMQKNGNSMG